MLVDSEEVGPHLAEFPLHLRVDGVADLSSGHDQRDMTIWLPSLSPTAHELIFLAAIAGVAVLFSRTNKDAEMVAVE